MTSVGVVMSNALIDVIVFQNVQPYISFTVLMYRLYTNYPNIARAFFAKHCSPVITAFLNAFRAPNVGKSLLNTALSAPIRRKHLKLFDLLPWVNTFSLNAHTHVNND